MTDMTDPQGPGAKSTMPDAGPPGAVAAPEYPDVLPPLPQLTGLRRAWSQHPSILLGGAIILVLVAMAVFAPFLGTQDPAVLSPIARLKSPSAEHFFGTDALGRDIYSRVVYGARVSLAVGLSCAILATLIGTAIGVLAGFVRVLDGIIMRIMDGLMSIPSILLAIALMTIASSSVYNVILAITIAELPRVARLVRSVVLSLREMPFVDAAVASGTTTPRIIVRHILPNVAAPVSVQATFICASAMLIEAGLSFIGAGTPPTIPSWGNVMSEGRALWQVKPHIIFFPAVFLSVSVLAVNMLGDGLRDAVDPRSATAR